MRRTDYDFDVITGPAVPPAPLPAAATAVAPPQPPAAPPPEGQQDAARR